MFSNFRVSNTTHSTTRHEVITNNHPEAIEWFNKSAALYKDAQMDIDVTMTLTRVDPIGVKPDEVLIEYTIPAAN